MNYIERLRQVREDARGLNAQAREALVDLLVYLTSEKFDRDSTVQVKDVYNRLGPIGDALSEARDVLA